MNKVNGWHCINDSDNWILYIDAKIIIADSKEHAYALYNAVTDIENSPFGAMVVVAPHQHDVNIFGEVATQSIFELPVVNADYVAKHAERAARIAARVWESTKTRLNHKKANEDLFTFLFGNS